MAWPPARGRRKWRAGVSRGGRGLSAWTRGIAPMSGVDSRCSQIPEPPGLNAVLLHLEVQGLVVGAEVSRRLALVPPAGVEGLADRLLLGVGCGRVGDLLQRGVERRRLSTECGRRGRVDRQDREVLRLDYIGSKEDGPANDVPELPHVPRPPVAHKDLSGRLRNCGAGTSEL